MKLLKMVLLAAGIILMAPLPTLNAQTVISDEKLVGTTFVVVKKGHQAFCYKSGCKAKVAMFDPVSITCPGTLGQTCIFHIALDAKVSFREGNTFYQFLIDNAAPTIGPTGEDGGYTIEGDSNWGMDGRFSLPASVVGTVTNSDSNNHTIAVNIGCHKSRDVCAVYANAATVRVDIFQP